MKILAIGDFHGKFPRKFTKIIRKEKIDIMLSNGDYTPFSLRDLFFKHIYMNPEKNLWEVIGKEKYKRITLRDLKDGEKILKKLNSLGIPVFTVLGNNDYPFGDDVRDFSKKERDRWKWKWEKDKLNFYPRIIKKYNNIHRVDYSYGKFGDYIIIGARGHSHPGAVKSKTYKKHKKILGKLFDKFKKENKEKKVIFLTHNMPYNTKLDKLSIRAIKFALKHAGKNKKIVKKRKRHYGSKMFRRVIKKYQPILQIGGHIDEGMGKQKLGRTLMVNCGPAHHGKAAIIELDAGRVKKVRFIR